MNHPIWERKGPYGSFFTSENIHKETLRRLLNACEGDVVKIELQQANSTNPDAPKFLFEIKAKRTSHVAETQDEA